METYEKFFITPKKNDIIPILLLNSYFRIKYFFSEFIN